MDCPVCGLINPDTARVCDCGHSFAASGETTAAEVEAFRLKRRRLVWAAVSAPFGYVVGYLAARLITHSTEHLASFIAAIALAAAVAVAVRLTTPRR